MARDAEILAAAFDQKARINFSLRSSKFDIPNDINDVAPTMTAAEAAIAYGVSANTIYKWAKLRGLKFHPRRPGERHGMCVPKPGGEPPAASHSAPKMFTARKFTIEALYMQGHLAFNAANHDTAWYRMKAALIMRRIWAKTQDSAHVSTDQTRVGSIVGHGRKQRDGEGIHEERFGALASSAVMKSAIDALGECANAVIPVVCMEMPAKGRLGKVCIGLDRLSDLWMLRERAASNQAAKPAQQNP